MTRRGVVLVLLLAAGLAGLVVSAQAWFSATGTDAAGAGGTGGTITFSGAEATGGLTQALAAVVLAGVLLTLVLAVRGRRVVALLIGLTGAAMTVVGALRTPPTAEAVRTRFRQVSLADQFSLDPTAAGWLYAAAGLVVVLGAALLWIGSPGWARRARRFERPGAEAGLGGTVAAPAEAPDDPAEAWRALDAGLDPTADTDSDPDVRTTAAADRMEPGQHPTSRRKIGDQ